MNLIQALAQQLFRIQRGEQMPDGQGAHIVQDAKRELAKLVAHLPSGSGFDKGTALLLDKSKPDKLVFQTGFHHMNEQGYYERWTDHTVTVTPSFIFGMNISVSGSDYNLVKVDIVMAFEHILSGGNY